MQLLVDGYNLMHAAGYLSTKAKPNLEATRKSFLNWLARISTRKSVAIRVVFDAHRALNASPESVYHGVKVRFAYNQTADDEIEILLRQASDCVVVSNDMRLHEAARRAEQAAWTCEEFTDWVLRNLKPPDPVSPPDPEKPLVPGPEDLELLTVFRSPRGPKS